MSEKSRLIKNTGLIAIGNFGAKMISFLLLPLYTSLLSTNEYGTYDFIVAISAFLLPVVTMSMHEAMFRFIIDSGNKGEEFKKTISNAFSAVLFGVLILGGVLIGVFVFTRIPELKYIWLYVTASALYTFSNNILRGLGCIKEYAIISSAKNILQLVLNVVVIAILHWGMDGLLFSICVSEVLAFLLVVCVCKLWKYIKWKYVSVENIRPMLRYSLPLIPNAICAQIINLSDRLVISGLMGASANGIYSISYKFPNMIETVYHYFYTAWSESASRVFAKGKAEATKYYQSLYDLISRIMFAVVLLMTAGMPILFRVFVRGDYIQGFSYVPLLLFAMYFDSLAKFYSGLFAALKKTKVMASSTVIAAIVNLVVNLVLIRKIGLYAAAGSTLVADITLAMVRRRFLLKDIELKINYKQLLSEIIVTGIVIALYSYDVWYKIIISIVISAGYSIFTNRTLIVSVFEKIKKKAQGRKSG